MDDTYLGKLPDRRWHLPRAGFPLGDGARTMSIDELRARRPSVTAGDVLLPALVMKQSALSNNLDLMQAFTSAHHVLFAPHAKTTMAPQLIQRQLVAGAWGITVANVFQAHVANLAGAHDILIANEVVGARDIEWLARMSTDDATSVAVLVDSPAAVAILDHGLGGAGAGGRQRVLIEVGHTGGRTGARDAGSVVATAAAVAGASHLALVGVATYEGVVAHDREAATLAKIDGYLDWVKATTVSLAEAGFFDELDRVIVSAGGTRFVDRVVERLAPGDWGGRQIDLVVRAGCYLTYGHRAGPNDSPFSGSSPFGQLIPALELWAEVLSLPEPALAIVAAGKRNVGDRPGAIVPIRLVRPGQPPGAAADMLTVTGLDDQHAYVAYRGVELRVGDRIGFGLQHPTALDRWQVVPVVDDDDRIIDAVATFFA